MVFLCLKLKAVAAYLHVEKIKQMEGRQAQYTRSLKATLPWRWTDVIMISARNIGTTTAAWPRRVLWVRSYARQASTKRRESNGSDVQWRWAHQGTPQNAPRLGFCWIIEQRSLLHFYFTNSGKVVAFGWAQFFVLCNLLQKWVCYACPKFWKFLPECTVGWNAPQKLKPVSDGQNGEPKQRLLTSIPCFISLAVRQATYIVKVTFWCTTNGPACLEVDERPSVGHKHNAKATNTTIDGIDEKMSSTTAERRLGPLKVHLWGETLPPWTAIARKPLHNLSQSSRAQ